MNIPSRVTVYVLADDLAGPNNPFIAQHGASYWLSLDYRGKKISILFDTGAYPGPIVENITRFGLDPHTIDYVILSHNHYDHTGGLLGVLEKIDHVVPVIAPSSLARTSINVGRRLRIINAPYFPAKFLDEIIARKGYPLLIDEPVKIADGVWTTGVFGGCSGSNEAFFIDNGRLVPDMLCDEIALVIDLGEHGLVVTGCAHPGIDRIVEKASTIIGKRIKYVLGGLHMVDLEEHRVRETTEKLMKHGVEKIYPGHCTGLEAEYILKKTYGENCQVLRVGMNITFP